MRQTEMKTWNILMTDTPQLASGGRNANKIDKREKASISILAASRHQSDLDSVALELLVASPGLEGQS
jgi:hypothetical protein